MADDVIRSVQGDTLDRLAWRERGLGAADLPALFAANPGLAGHGAVLPIGTHVVVPISARAAVTIPVVQLWD